MIALVKLRKNTKYFFYAHNCVWVGYFVEISDLNIHVRNGHLFRPNELVYAYHEAFLDPKQIIGFAKA